jgi:large conductance mechanosensitive channel
MGLTSEFLTFIEEYKVMGLAVAFIIGVALTALIQSFVNDIVMPVITPFIPGGGWQQATFAAGPIVLRWGSFLGAVINFLVIAIVVFLIAKTMFKEKKAAKK